MALQKVFFEGFPRAISWVAVPQEYSIQAQLCRLPTRKEVGI